MPLLGKSGPARMGESDLIARNAAITLSGKQQIYNYGDHRPAIRPAI
jgi:hypothetical protein